MPAHSAHALTARCCWAGDSLLLWDPQGRYLSSGAQAAGVGKQYQLAGTQLADSFADQFAPWRFAGAALGSRVDATLIRLPLRTAAAAEGGLSKVRGLLLWTAGSRRHLRPAQVSAAACRPQSGGQLCCKSMWGRLPGIGHVLLLPGPRLHAARTSRRVDMRVHGLLVQTGSCARHADVRVPLWWPSSLPGLGIRLLSPSAGSSSTSTAAQAWRAGSPCMRRRLSRRRRQRKP